MNTRFMCRQFPVQPQPCPRVGGGSGDVPFRIVVRGPEARTAASRVLPIHAPRRKDVAGMLLSILQSKIYLHAGLCVGWEAALALRAQAI